MTDLETLVPASAENAQLQQQLIIQEGMMAAYLASLPSRVFTETINTICDSSTITRLSCEAIAETFQEKIIQPTVAIAKILTPTSVQDKLRSINQEVGKITREMPNKFYDKYQIPKEQTEQFLESMQHNLSYLASWGAGKALTSLKSVIKANPINFEFTLPPKIKSFMTKNKVIDYLITPINQEAIHISLSRVKGLKKYSLPILRGIKNIATEYKVKSVYVQTQDKAPIFKLSESALPEVFVGTRGQNKIDLIPLNSELYFGLTQNQSSLPLEIYTPSFPEVTANHLLDLAGTLTGIKPAINEVNQIKTTLVRIFQCPQDAPELLLNQLYQGPKEIYQNMLKAGKSVFQSDFMSNPSFQGAIGIASGVFQILTLANDLLPIAHAIKKDAIKNPAMLPVTVTREFARLIYNKIVGVVHLIKDLFRDPVRAGRELFKSIIKMPENVFRSLRNLFGIRSRSQKRRKRMMEEMERQRLAEEQALKEQLARELVLCFNFARSQWMVYPDETLDNYCQNIIKDWHQASKDNLYQGDLLNYLKIVKSHLDLGRLAHAYQLAPTAHTEGIVAPPEIALVFKDLVFSSISFQVALVKLDQSVMEFSESVQKLMISTLELSQTNEELNELLTEKGEVIKQRLRERLRGRQLIL